jgi:hypothetical protein
MTMTAATADGRAGAIRTTMMTTVLAGVRSQTHEADQTATMTMAVLPDPEAVVSPDVPKVRRAVEAALPAVRAVATVAGLAISAPTPRLPRRAGSTAVNS